MDSSLCWGDDFDGFITNLLYLRNIHMNNIIIRKVELLDSLEIARIYNHYIRNTIITFEEKEITQDDISSRIKNVLSKSLHWIVAENESSIVGYAYASKWKNRSAYRFSVESTVYIEQNFFGNGIGTLLYKELLTRLKKSGIHCVIGVIALPNPSSIALHEKFGFRQVGHINEVGIKFNKWIDVGYWQLQFDSNNQ